MSSTNPRRAAFRSEGQSPRHQYSHPGSKSSTPQPSTIKESDEVRALRAKFGAELRQVKEVFPAWSDEDVLNLLSETNGSVDSAVARIADGRAEQWDAVPRKKDKRGGAPSGGGSPHLQQQHYARDRAESGGAASPGRGSGFRGGRGGGRGGRGGGNVGRSGGRGGHHNVNGRGLSPPAGGDPATAHPDDDAPASESTDDNRKPAGQTNGTVADGVVQTPSEQEQKPADKQAPHKLNGASSLPPKPQQPPAKVAPAAPAKMSWAQIAKPKPKPVAPPVQQPQPQAGPPAIGSAPLPAPPKAEEPAQAGTEGPSAHESQALEEEKPAAEAPPAEDSASEALASPIEQESATTAPGDDWIAITPPPKPSVELPSSVPASTEAPASKSWTEIAAPAAPVCTSTPAADAPTSTTQDASEVATAPPPAAAPEVLPAPPPGLPSLPSSTPAAPAPSSIPRSSTPSTKPATPRPTSHRVSARFRSDAPVVMPGGIGHIGTGTPTLSFGSAVVGSGFDTPTRSMQFGSLSLNDDLDSSAPIEPPAPEPVQEEEPAPAPVPAPVPVPTIAQPLEPVPAPKPEPSPPAPVAAPAPEPRAPTPPQQQVQQQAPPSLPSTGLGGISSIYQQQHSSPLPSLPQQVTAAQSAIPSQAQASATPSSLPFTSQGPAPGLQLPQQQQNHQAQSLATHAHQAAQSQHVSPAQSTNNLHATSQHQAQSQTQTTQQPTPQHLPYSANHQLPPHLDASLTTQQPAHPAVAAQNQYFRQESSYFHTPTPPHTQSIVPQTQHQLSQAQDHSLSHSSPYGNFSPLAQTQASHLSGFGGSPAPGDYGTYDAQRNFYDTYGQASAFPNRTQLGHEDTTKTGLPGSTPASAGLGQQSSTLGQGQPALTAAQQAQQQQQFPGMMPYYYSQPYYMPNQYYPQSNPYPPQPPYVKYPSYQPPHQPGAPPLQQQGAKPPASTATPYGSQQTHNYHPGQTTSYEDPSGVGYQQGNTTTGDYGKQAPLYSQGIQNFFGAQTPVQSAGGPQLGTAGQQRGASGTSTSPENSYKGYTGPAGVADKQGQQQTGQGRGSVPGGPQPQGGYYNNRYNNAPQAPAQAYPQSDGQFYPSYQHQQPRQPYWP